MHGKGWDFWGELLGAGESRGREERARGRVSEAGEWGALPELFRTKGREERAGGMGIGQKGGGKGDRVVCVWTAWLCQ